MRPGRRTFVDAEDRAACSSAGPDFVHIRCFAIRDKAGADLGTLEVTRERSPLRVLEGERRLLQYGDIPDAS